MAAQKKRLYVIRTIEGNVIQCRFTEKKYADEWMLQNNNTEDGKPLNLYKLTKEAL